MMAKSAEERARHCASDLRDADVVNWIDQLAAIPIIAAAIREDRAEPVSEAEVEAGHNAYDAEEHKGGTNFDCISAALEAARQARATADEKGGAR